MSDVAMDMVNRAKAVQEAVNEITNPRPAWCCGKCPGIKGGGYDCTCIGNEKCAKELIEEAREWVRGTAEGHFIHRLADVLEATVRQMNSSPEVEDEAHTARLLRIVSQIELGMNCQVRVEFDEERGESFVQIKCWRMDVITKEMGWGFGGKAWPSPHATDSEIVQMIFGLYKGYWEHEAREAFEWRERRIYGPHIDANALWDVARRVDVRSAKHVEDVK